MKRKQLFSILGLIVVLVFSLLLTGCGKQEGSEFIGTWKSTSPNNTLQSYLVIKKVSDQSFIIEEYDMHVSSFDNKKYSKRKDYPATYEKGTLKYPYGNYFLNDNTLKSSDKGQDVFTKYSDKPLSFKEFNTDGYPEPK